MKPSAPIFLVFFSLLIAGDVARAAYPVRPQTDDDSVLSEKRDLLQDIRAEKNRIAGDYQYTDSRLFDLVDSMVAFIRAQPVPDSRKNLYLTRLRIFLADIDHDYSEAYLKSGTYRAILSYDPAMVEWDQRGELSKNLKRYSAFSMKAVSLIPDDTAAEDFLTDYMNGHPDDIFRYAGDFDDRQFALSLLEKATKLAPESAKRYYSTSNAVGDLLNTSTDLFVKTSLEVYSRFGIKSRAYLLLNEIIKNQMSLRTADSIGNNREQLFERLVNLSMNNVADISYSMFRYLDVYSVETMRNIQQESLGRDYTFQTFKDYTAGQMFMLLAYGYKETTFKTFDSLFEILEKKAGATPVSTAMISSMDKEKLKALVIYCDKNKMLQRLLDMAGDRQKEYLLSLPAMEEKEIELPPLKTFAKDNPAIASIPIDKKANDIEPVKTTKTLAPDSFVAEAARPEIENPLSAKKFAAFMLMKSREADAARSQKSGEGNNEALLKEKTLPKTVVNTSAAPSATIASAGVKAPSPASIVYLVRGRPVPDIAAAENVEPVTIHLDARTRAVISLKKNILQTIQNIPSFINKDYAEEILMYAARKEPDDLIKKIDDFKSKSFCKHVLEVCALNAPVSVKRYLFNSMEPVNYILHYSDNPVVKRIIEISPQLGSHSKALLLLDDIMNNRDSLNDAIAISAVPQRLFGAMVKIISRPDYIGKYSIDREMRDYSLRFIREINEKIATGNTHPFSSVEGFASAELYFLMLYGRDEVFTSTFTGLFDRFMLKLPGDDGDAFLNSVGNNRFRDFLSLCANFGTLEEFLTKFPAGAKKKLLVSYISSLESEQDDLSSIVLITEAISNLVDSQLLTVLQYNIMKEYERVKAANNPIGISIYGVLSSMISGNARIDAGWYKKVSQQFKIMPANMLSTAALFNKRSACIEQMYFYDDEDGRSSYINFIRTYRNQAAWGLEDRNTYVRIFSRSQMPVEIFANKPAFEETGVRAIEAYFREKNLVPSVVVHRGHSFHTESTLEKITPSARLIFLGSCGGFYKISMALENAPDAHVISTKQVGTKTINDVMLFALNESIRCGKDIEWNEFWDQMRDKLGNNQYFSDYVPPHKNLEAIFIRAYYKIIGV